MFNTTFINKNEIKKNIIKLMNGEDEELIDTKLILNKDTYMNRILGLVSYFAEVIAKDKVLNKEGQLIDVNVFPKVIIPFNNMEEMMINMSDYQFLKYQEVRTAEIKEEDRLNNIRKRFNSVNMVLKVANSFKVKSRQRLLFVFPPNIDRPDLKSLKINKNQIIVKDDEYSEDDIKK